MNKKMRLNLKFTNFKSSYLIVIAAFMTVQLQAQDTSYVGNSTVIVETITTIDKNDLFDNWDKMTGDTLSPTSILLDMNGDEKTDIVGFFTGIEHGLFIYGNVEEIDGEIKRLYKLDIDSTWYEEGLFQAVITPVESGEKFILKTGENLELKNESALIKKRNGSLFVLTFMNDEWHYFEVKRA